MKTYTAKSSAIRAAKKAGISDPILTLSGMDDSWSYSERPKPQAAPKPLGKRAQIEADAAAGKIPAAPDFRAETHKYYRKGLAAAIKAVLAEDVALLKAMNIPDYNSSARAIGRYRSLAVTALEARAAK